MAGWACEPAPFRLRARTSVRVWTCAHDTASVAAVPLHARRTAGAAGRRALEASEQVLGPNHPSTLVIMSNLGLLLQAKGDYDGAEPLYRRARSQQRRCVGAVVVVRAWLVAAWAWGVDGGGWGWWFEWREETARGAGCGE